jgi:hypothetical protein
MVSTESLDADKEEDDSTSGVTGAELGDARSGVGAFEVEGGALSDGLMIDSEGVADVLACSDEVGSVEVRTASVLRAGSDTD